MEKGDKNKIKLAMEKKMAEKRSVSKKMRFLKKSGSDTYLQDTYNDDARLALKIRLNMVEWVEGNFGGSGCCPICGGTDTTEHVFECGNEMVETVNVKNLEEGRSMAEIVKHFRNTEEKRKEILMNNVQVKMERYHRDGTVKW